MTDSTLFDRQISLFSIPKNRIDWIDIAKGIAIILVIVGHTVKHGSGTRNFIFSFHMPLFFILSGYTYKMADSWNTFIRHLKKGAQHLLVPCLVVAIINVVGAWIQSGVYDISTLWHITKQMGDALWWASGVKVHAHPAARAIWFLFSLFWAKTLMDSINLAFSGKYNGSIFIFLGMAGIALGLKGKWLPQNLDVTLVAVLFVYVGMLWKKYYEAIEKYSEGLLLLSVVFWTLCLQYNMYIEMAIRSYPFLFVSVVEAVCASFAICYLCKALAQNTWIKQIFIFVGMHTLSIFVVHCLDWIWKSWWQVNSYWGTCGLRVVVVLGVALTFYIIRYYLQIKRTLRT